MRDYVRVQSLLAFFAVAYLTLAIVGRFTFPEKEIFPFFAWNLFDRVPNQQSDYVVQILAVGEQPLAVPVAFSDASEWFEDTESITAYHSLQKLGKAARNGRDEELLERREVFEATFLAGAGPVDYELVRRRYRPLERWRDGTFLSSEPMARFRYDPQAQSR